MLRSRAFISLYAFVGVYRGVYNGFRERLSGIQGLRGFRAAEVAVVGLLALGLWGFRA